MFKFLEIEYAEIWADGQTDMSLTMCLIYSDFVNRKQYRNYFHLVSACNVPTWSYYVQQARITH
jgi:hypothetical protein